ncbi:unnamed protein product [Cyprideis torosa]|uniref:phosphoribosylaminoimidazolesuccinocarboxamide synthase n=1 Tax=Cyprideis torosa TaxID=163714 RepID=A0A7R8WW30_9CRUS|nr:unnamed protein product [Cyprideis torosa]CAG0907682.1 unnamed protein product [Cyprideis torosa]
MAQRLGLEEGGKSPVTIIDLCYKKDELGDPLINDHHAVLLGAATYEELQEIYAITRKINEVLIDLFDKIDIILVDFKLEFGKDSTGKIMLADEISPDTCRLWDKHTLKKLDKDRFRRDLGEKYIDINCDLGEGIGNDEAIFPYISSCNIACTYHAGDAHSMIHSIEQALAHKVRIGAHPAYADREGFGRRPMALSLKALREILLHQLALLEGLCHKLGAQLEYVKAHGALYHRLGAEAEEAKVLADVLLTYFPQLAVMGQEGTVLESICKQESIPFIREAFGDRAYTQEGRLLSRSEKGAQLSDPAEVLTQVLQMLNEGQVRSHTGEWISIHADSICLHGDQPHAAEIAAYLHQELPNHGYIVGRS